MPLYAPRVYYFVRIRCFLTDSYAIFINAHKIRLWRRVYKTRPNTDNVSVDIRCPPLPVGRSGSVPRVWPLTLSLRFPGEPSTGPEADRNAGPAVGVNNVGTGYVKQIKRAVETRPSVRIKIIIIIIIIAKTDNARQENVDSIIILLLRFACVESRVLRRRSDLRVPRRWNSTADGDLRCFFFVFIRSFTRSYCIAFFVFRVRFVFRGKSLENTRLWFITSRFITIIGFCQDFAPNDDVSRRLL